MKSIIILFTFFCAIILGTFEEFNEKCGWKEFENIENEAVVQSLIKNKILANEAIQKE